MRTMSMRDAARDGEAELPLEGRSPDLATIQDLQKQLADSRAQCTDWCTKYEEIRASTAYRLGSKISNSALGTAYRALNRWKSARAAVDGKEKQQNVRGNFSSPDTSIYRSPIFRAAIAGFPNSEPIALAHPEWLGIRSSATQMFDNLLCVGDDLTPTTAQEIASHLVSRSPSAIVFHGFPFTYQYLVEDLSQKFPQIPLYVVWHGTFMQAPEDYAWRSFRLMCALHRQGKIRRIGLVKKGQEQILRHRGIDAHYLLNMYRVIPEAATNVPTVPIKLGIWSISELKHKPPYEMLAAASTIDGAQVVGSVASERMLEFCKEFGLAQSFLGRMVPQAEMPAQLATAHLNLYVTLNECAPMLPLESFGVGVPCIVGPNTPYFENAPYLLSRLVVPVPDDAYAIAQKIKLALSERDQIIAAYREYAVEHNAESALTLQRFLS